MPSEGGRYRIKNGKRELVHRTKPAPVQPADTPVKADTTAPKPAKQAAKKEGSSNGSE